MYIDQIENTNSDLERVGDFLIFPARTFFGHTYRLEGGVLKRPENVSTVSKIVFRIASIALFPISIISTLFGLVCKALAYAIDPSLKKRFFLPVLINARSEENFSGKLPPNPWTPNCVNSQQKSLWGKLYDVDPMIVPAEMENPIDFMKELMRTLKAPHFNAENVQLIEEKARYLRYEYKVVIPSGPLKGTYIDDLDLYFDPDANRFHIRSASRKGFRDALHFDFSQWGANKKRVEEIRGAFPGYI